MVSVYGYATGNALQSPRLLFAMARAGELPALRRVHPRFHTPHAAIAAYALATGALALHGSFEWNATLSPVVRLATYAATCAALVVLRRRTAEPAGFTVPAGPWVAAGGGLFCLWLLSTRSLAQGGVVLGLAAAGALLWLARGRQATAPAP